MEQVGPYKIIQEIGQGGMATVYLAHQPSVNRVIALKVLPAKLAADVTSVGRFRQEAETGANLNHENIVKVWDASVSHAPYYIAMEYLDGGSLADRLMQGSLQIDEALAIMKKLCNALDYAHHHPHGAVVHRDIKPANIMFDSHGRPVLMDFGIARVADQTRLTADGAKFGTPDYMSPEQAKGTPVDYRSDIYSLAVVFYEMVTSRPPFLNENSLVTMRQIIDDPLPSPCQWNPAINGQMAAVLTKALAKHPDDRYQSCREFAKALSAAYLTPVAMQFSGVLSGKANSITNNDSGHAEKIEKKRGAHQNTFLTAILIGVLLTIGTIIGFAMLGKPGTVGSGAVTVPHGSGTVGSGSGVGPGPGPVAGPGPVLETKVIMPDVSGLSLNDTRVALSASGLTDKNKVPLNEYSATTKGDVIRSDPDKGVTVDKGTEVTLILSLGPTPSIPPKPPKTIVRSPEGKVDIPPTTPEVKAETPPPPPVIECPKCKKKLAPGEVLHDHQLGHTK